MRGEPSTGGAAGRRADEPGQPDELRVELLVERAAGAAHGRDRVERARDVGAVGVVLGRVDLPARRQQGDQRHGKAERRQRRCRDGVAQARPDALAHRERGQQPEPERAQRDDRDQRAQVAGQRVARLRAHVVDLERCAAREPLQRRAVDRAHVDAQAHRQADRLEARTPVDERHVDVERALVRR